jgi:hypothetical protein
VVCRGLCIKDSVAFLRLYETAWLEEEHVAAYINTAMCSGPVSSFILPITPINALNTT